MIVKRINRNYKYIDRLILEWQTHGKIIIAVDYDSTIAAWPTIDNFEDIEKTIELLQVAYNTGAYITINTCSSVDRFEDIQKHCDELNIPINSINRNPFDLPYGKNGKIYANIYLDDRSGLKDALDILETAMYIIRGEKSKDLTIGESI